MKRALAVGAIGIAFLAVGCTSGEATPSKTAASSAPASSASAGAATCTLSSDGNTFTLQATNTSSTTMTYAGEVTISKGGEPLTNVTVEALYVAPGEKLGQLEYTGVAEQAPDECSAAGVTATEETPPSVGASDVSGCKDLREGEWGDLAYDLTVKNSSTKVPAEYSIRVAIREADGTRVSTRLVLAAWDTGNWTAVKPGETVTQNDEALGIDYASGQTCEVISVSKQTSGDFFESDDEGVSKGSISADIAFASGSAALTDDAKVLLQTAIEPLASTTGPVCVAGYADSVGDKKANQALSQERADAVAAYLKASGVSADIQTVGKGESEAAKDDVDDPALRRVDITMAACS